MTRAAKTYHHGDLRNALIIAAAELIEESGSLNFTMADAARRAGVSMAAPYRHFRDKDDLLDAVSQLAFYGLGAAAHKATADIPLGRIERIVALGHTYYHYVVDKAAFYDLMWGDIGARAIGADSFDREASGFLQLLRAVEAYLHAEGLSDFDTLDVSIKLWSLVHGLSAITMSGKLVYFHPDANVPAMIDESARTFMRGLKAQRYRAQRGRASGRKR